MTPTSMAAMALAYAAYGWSNFPLYSAPNGVCNCWKGQQCADPGKHPRTQNGLLSATCDPEQIHRWYVKQWPDSNIAIRTGAVSGLAVLDVDTRHDGDATLQRLTEKHGALPTTLIVGTGGGGLHYYFAHPGPMVKVTCTESKVGVGLDVRGDGGYVVAPPSLHVSGRTYAWKTVRGDLPKTLAPWPHWLRELNEAPSAGRMNLNRVLGGVPEGGGGDEGRDVSLFKLAALLRRYDVPRDVGEAVVLYAAERCLPAFPSDDALAKVASAYERYAPEPETPIVARRPMRVVL